jgi:hypothetical protein
MSRSAGPSTSTGIVPICTIYGCETPKYGTYMTRNTWLGLVAKS